MSFLIMLGATLVGLVALFLILFLGALIIAKPAEVFGVLIVAVICLYLGLNIFDWLGWWTF